MAGSDIADALQRLSRRPIVVASHPRSGTHLTIDLFRKQFRECRSWKWWGENLNRLYLSLEALFEPAPPSPISEARALGVLRRVPRPLVKTHFLTDLGAQTAIRRSVHDRAWREWLREHAHFYYVYRDVRDVMCSYHHFRRRFDSAARCPLSEFIRHKENGRSRIGLWAHHVRSWLSEPDVHGLRFEDIVNDPRRVLSRLGGEIGLTPLFREPLLPRKIRDKWHGRLIRVVGRCPEGAGALEQEGGPPLEKWREALSRADRAFVHQEAGDLLLELDYESSVAWVESPPS